MKNLIQEESSLYKFPITVTIEKMGNKGDGISSKSMIYNKSKKCYILFIPGALPGEIVSVIPKKISSEIIYCEIIKILSSSKNRIKEDCNVSQKCGGCSFRHVKSNWLENWKYENLLSNLSKSKITNKVLNISSSPNFSRRRALFSFSNKNGNLILGFNSFQSNEVINIDDCKTLTPFLLKLITNFKIFLKTMNFPKNLISKIQINQLDKGADVLIMINKNFYDNTKVLMKLVEFATANKVLRLSLKKGDEIEIFFKNGECNLTLGKFQNKTLIITPPPGGFLQPTTHGENEIIKSVLSVTIKAKNVADLFCGCGTLSLPIAENSVIYSADINKESILSLRKAINKQFKSNKAVTIHQNLHKNPIKASILKKMDVIVFNPPANGALEQVKEIAKSLVKVVVSVSCNQSTFIRDAKLLLEANYNIEWLKPIDQFPNTNHLEIIAKFILKN